MRKVTLRSLWEHKRRLISTVVAILLGVAFMAGTLVLSDTLNSTFDDLFADVGAGIDAQVQGEVLFESFLGETRGRLPEDLLDDVRAVDGVAAADPYVASLSGTLLGADGDPVGGQGPPTFLENWGENDELNPYNIVEGRAPEAEGEAMLNLGAAEMGEYAVGDRIAVLTQEGRLEFDLVGLVAFGNAESAAGSVGIQLVLSEAQRLAGAEGQLDAISARAEAGLTQQELVDRIAPLLPDGAEVITGEQFSEQNADAIQEGFGFFSNLLLVFAAIALFVGIFIIYNTFSILVAQRTKEMALLRALGASRRQVLGSVMLEALVIGLVAGLLGLLVGIGLAVGVQAALDAIGVDLPTASTVITPTTVITAFVVGVVVTVLAAIVPALKATRVPPLAAMRDVAVDTAGTSKVRAAIGAVVLLLGTAALVGTVTGESDVDDLPMVGLGALLVFVGVIVIGPVIATPFTRVLGAWLPKARGITGRLARENAMRNPKRTSATAAALMIGVALIAFITAFASSAQASIEKEVDRGFRGDFVLQATGNTGFGGVSPELSAEIADIDGVEIVSGVRAGPGGITLADGDTSGTFIGGVDPQTFGEVFDVLMTEGRLTDLTDEGIVVDRQIAEAEGLAIGDPVTVTFPGTATAALTIDAISNDQAVLGVWTISADTYSSLAAEQLESLVGIGLAAGTDPAEVRPAIEAAADAYPTVAVQDRQEFTDSLTGQVSGFLNFIYGLLALSVIIAVIGIANTISLSVYERTHELGLLRAVGMSRRQIRSSIRWESMLVALLGTAIGLVVGVALSYAVVEALSQSGLTVYRLPITTLIVVVVVGAVLGVLAALRPASRAAKLDVLRAIAAE
jgi:putative ABC transport system permease protein